MNSFSLAEHRDFCDGVYPTEEEQGTPDCHEGPVLLKPTRKHCCKKVYPVRRQCLQEVLIRAKTVSSCRTN